MIITDEKLKGSIEDYKWQKLTTAAAYYDYDWNVKGIEAHNSLADCFATLFVYHKILSGE